MEAYQIFRDLAIIILAAKFFGIVARKFKAPSVVGEIIAGLIIGPSLLGLVQESDFTVMMAEIGVVLLMFSAGLETNLKELIKTGPIAFLIACCGVFVPLVGGTVLYSAFYGFAAVGTHEFYRAVFIGVIMTATSVSITVQALKEMGKLKGKVGTTILSAAIIDDIIGIIVLTFVIGFENPSANPGSVVISTILFFLCAIGFGLILFYIFNKIDIRYPHTHRIPIMSLGLCFLFAYMAEEFFGIADITGAYAAGIILCSIKDHDYVAAKIDINSYMIFGPIFFVGIGLKTNFDHVDASLLLFSIAFVIVALSTKIIGCGLMAKATKHSWNDSLKIGVGMMTRGEVALIVAQKGLSVGLLDSQFFTAVILLIIVSSISTPLILKYLYSLDDKKVSSETVKIVENTHALGRKNGYR